MNLAQQIAPITSSTVGEALGLAERVAAMSPQAILALLSMLAFGVAYWQMRERQRSEERASALEKARADAAETSSTKRLEEARAEARARAADLAALNKERLTAERESNETLAHAVAAMEAAQRQGERLERLLERLAAKGV